MMMTRGSLFSQGAVAGLIGFATLAIFFSVNDLMSGRPPLHSAAVLGAAIFYDVSDPAQVAVLPAYVLAYNGAHLLVYLLLGMIAALLAKLADRGRQLWYVSAFFFVFVTFHAIGFVQGLSAEMRGLLSARSLWIGGLLASLAMGTYLVWAHPQLRRPQRWDG